MFKKGVFSMSEARQRYVDWLRWYEEHKRDGGDLVKKVEFLQKCVEGQFLIIGSLLNQQSNGRNSVLFTPQGVAYVP